MTKINVDRLNQKSNQEKVHRSDLHLLAQHLSASLIEQQDYLIKPLDRIAANFSGTPANWAFARAIAEQLGSDDLVFCPGEEIGIPLATVCDRQKVKPKIVVWLHRITGLRTRVALKLFRVANSVDLFIVSNLTNKEFLKTYLNISGERILFLRHFVDDRYFTPGTSKRIKSRSLIMSVGLEYRDYQLLAEATADLDLDVKIAGFSQFQSRTARYLPQVMPANMSNRKYSWLELIELYRRADLVVICLKDNTAAAGVTVLLEAMCCQKPIICTRTEGLQEYLQNEAVMTVEPGNVKELRNAIIYLLEHPKEAEQMGKRGLQLVKQRHNLDSQVKVLGEFIQTLEQN